MQISLQNIKNENNNLEQAKNKLFSDLKYLE